MQEGGPVVCIPTPLQGILVPARERTAEVEPGLPTAHSPHHALLPVPSQPPSVASNADSVHLCVCDLWLLSCLAFGALPADWPRECLAARPGVLLSARTGEGSGEQRRPPSQPIKPRVTGQHLRLQEPRPNRSRREAPRGGGRGHPGSTLPESSHLNPLGLLVAPVDMARHSRKWLCVFRCFWNLFWFVYFSVHSPFLCFRGQLPSLPPRAGRAP